jgi:hypothetical protein
MRPSEMNRKGAVGMERAPTVMGTYVGVSVQSQMEFVC